MIVSVISTMSYLQTVGMAHRDMKPANKFITEAGEVKIIDFGESKDYFKEYLKLDPGEMQVYSSMIHLPWSFKILYGMISDNVPICGFRRKSWLIIMGLIQFIFLFLIFILESDEPLTVTVLLVVVSISKSFLDVVTDAIMVIQARKDKDYGSQDFVTLLYLNAGFVGVIGSIFGGFMTQNYHPKWCFLSYSVMGLVIAFFAACLTKESEKDSTETDEEFR